MNPLVVALVEIVAGYYGVTSGEVLGRGRSQSVADARSVAMWLTRETYKMSYPEIGRAFGRDHTTVMHACRKVKDALTCGHSDRTADVALLARLRIGGTNEKDRTALVG